METRQIPIVQTANVLNLRDTSMKCLETDLFNTFLCSTIFVSILVGLFLMWHTATKFLWHFIQFNYVKHLILINNTDLLQFCEIFLQILQLFLLHQNAPVFSKWVKCHTYSNPINSISNLTLDFKFKITIPWSPTTLSHPSCIWPTIFTNCCNPKLYEHVTKVVSQPT